MTEAFSPLVQDTTKSQSESIETVLARLQGKRVYIPDYQRDSEQWGEEKKSLFIESILNNLTIPAFFFCEDETRNNEVVDGQQRLNTIWDFFEGNFRLSDDLKINYITPSSILYAGKEFNQLAPVLQNIFRDYPLTIIYLPKNLPLQTKLEIFRRINEGGTPLSGQDIRLAYYSKSKSVTFIRLVGLHEIPSDVKDTMSSIDDELNSSSKPFRRMLDTAKSHGISDPWSNHKRAKFCWDSWWYQRDKAKGQTPSLTFLWYLICLDRNKLDDLLKRPNHLPIKYDGSIENALDIYCAQLAYQEQTHGEPLVSSFEVISQEYFVKFAEWMYRILSSGIPGISVDKYKQLALFIAGVVELEKSPTKVSDKSWNQIGDFIRNPRKSGKIILNDENGYTEPKGRWGGEKGQRIQCEKAVEIVKKILKQ